MRSALREERERERRAAAHVPLPRWGRVQPCRRSLQRHSGEANREQFTEEDDAACHAIAAARILSQPHPSSASRFMCCSLSLSLSGLPLPVDTLHSYGWFYSILPRDRYIVSSEGLSYVYDAVMQRTTSMGTMIDYFSPPHGSGISYAPGFQFGSWNSSTLWNNDFTYEFIRDTYWRWKAAPDTPSGQSNTASGWAPPLVGMDSWVTTNTLWSHIFKGDTVWRYDNMRVRCRTEIHGGCGRD